MDRPSDEAMKRAKKFLATYAIPRMSEETIERILKDRADMLAEFKARRENGQESAEAEETKKRPLK